MRLQFKLATIPSNQRITQFWLGYITYLFYVRNIFYFFMITYRNSEEQLIILASVHGSSSEIHVKFLTCCSRLIVYGYVFFIYSTSTMTSFSYMQELATQSVRNINHSRRPYSSLPQRGNNVSACLRLELSIYQIFLSGKVRFKIL